MEVAGPKRGPGNAVGRALSWGWGNFGQILRVPSFPSAHRGGLDLSNTSPASRNCRIHSVKEYVESVPKTHGWGRPGRPGGPWLCPYFPHSSQGSAEQLETLEDKVSDCLNSLVPWRGGLGGFCLLGRASLEPHHTPSHTPTHTPFSSSISSVLDGQLQDGWAHLTYCCTLNNWNRAWHTVGAQ